MKVASGALWESSQALMLSSSARFASQERFGSDLGSISRPSRLQNRCSRVGESIDFRKSTFPLSILNLISKSPLKRPSRTPRNRSRRLQSALRGLPDALGDGFWFSGGLLERSWVLSGRFGALRALIGVPLHPLGNILWGFCNDLGVHTAEEEYIHYKSW